MKVSDQWDTKWHFLNVTHAQQRCEEHFLGAIQRSSIPPTPTDWLRRAVQRHPPLPHPTDRRHHPPLQLTKWLRSPLVPPPPWRPTDWPGAGLAALPPPPPLPAAAEAASRQQWSAASADTPALPPLTSHGWVPPATHTPAASDCRWAHRHSLHPFTAIATGHPHTGTRVDGNIPSKVTPVSDNVLTTVTRVSQCPHLLTHPTTSPALLPSRPRSPAPGRGSEVRPRWAPSATLGATSVRSTPRFEDMVSRERHPRGRCCREVKRARQWLR